MFLEVDADDSALTCIKVFCLNLILLSSEEFYLLADTLNERANEAA